MDDAGEKAITYWLVFGGLLLLTGLTVGAAYVDLGMWSDPAALGIASLKAALIVLFFMHARRSQPLVFATIAVAVCFLLLLLGGTLLDVMMRTVV